MIVLDTHVWVWWVDGNPRLRPDVREQLDSERDLRVSAISLLEIATAASLNRLVLRPSVGAWLQIAQSIEPLTAAVCLDSVMLPGEFHRDPADRLVVALARQHSAPICIADSKTLAYPHVTRIRADA